MGANGGCQALGHISRSVLIFLTAWQVDTITVPILQTRQVACLSHIVSGEWRYKARCSEATSSAPVSLLELLNKSNVPLWGPQRQQRRVETALSLDV